MKIRILELSDIGKVVELWYETSILAHNFVPSAYWLKNKDAMANEYLPNSETYLAEEDDEILGFVTMVKNHLAAIFIKPGAQGMGIGFQLLDYVKSLRKNIQLKVYKKNVRAIQFYRRHDFSLLSEHTESETGEMEYLMEWKRQKSV